MIEFLVRTVADDDIRLPLLMRDREADVLTPVGCGCERIDGWGDHRLRCGDTEVAFSHESVGWQVSIEGPMDQATAERLVATVAKQVEREVGEPIEWIQISR